jgi:putative phage-type endonuclease
MNNTVKFYYDHECKQPSPERLVYLRNQVKELMQRPQPEQRTPPWYEMRNNMVTSSDWGSVTGDNKYKSYNDLLLGKCGQAKPFWAGPAIKWGVKYEEVANMIYMYRNNCKVLEFGCIQHHTHDWLGASPDGISTDGVMLEIKCPMSRVITGIPPAYYWVQVQGQLEVCELDRCDFLECKLEEYFSADFYFEDTNEKDVRLNKAGMEKGCVLVFRDKTTQDPIFIYSKIGITKEEYETWLVEEKKKFFADEKHKNMYFSVSSFWQLLHASCVPIYRDQGWFKETLPKLDKFWKDVLHYREVGCEELMPKKRTKMTGIDINIGNTPKEFNTMQSLFSSATFTEKPKTSNTSSSNTSLSSSLFSSSTFTEKPKTSNTSSSNTSLSSSLFSVETFKPIRKKPKKEKDKIRNLFSSDTFKPLLNRSKTTDKLLDIGNNNSTLDDDLEKSLEMLKNLTISVEQNKRKSSKKLESEIKKKSKNEVCLFSDM